MFAGVDPPLLTDFSGDVIKDSSGGPGNDGGWLSDCLGRKSLEILLLCRTREDCFLDRGGIGRGVGGRLPKSPAAISEAVG